jgi:drug/metabolite transporter (DMT)-like permease
MCRAARCRDERCIHLWAASWPWLALSVAIVSMSAGATFFSLLDAATPPVLRASWRLWATSWIQLVPFGIQMFQTVRGNAELLAVWLRSLPILIAVGCILSIHFSLWVWGITHTSLTHSLLFVTAHPILIILASWSLYAVHLLTKPCRRAREDAEDSTLIEMTPMGDGAEAMALDPDAMAGLTVAHSLPLPENGIPGRTAERFPRRGVCSLQSCSSPPNWLETLGAAVGFAGSTIMVLLAAEEDGPVTVEGDMASLGGAAAMALYLVAGRFFRGDHKFPLFMYALPVTLSAALLTTAASFGLEGDVVSWDGSIAAVGAFGWLFDGRTALVVMAMAVVSGICGHTFANMALSHIPTLVASVSLLLEPVIGSVIGYLAGVQGVPSGFTFLGGVILLVGAGMVTFGGWKREQQRRPRVPRTEEEEEEQDRQREKQLRETAPTASSESSTRTSGSSSKAQGWVPDAVRAEPRRAAVGVSV